MATFIRTVLAVVAAAWLGVAAPAAAATQCNDDCGRVQSVRYVEKAGEASGVGAVAGGVLGGVIGHQFGSGRGNTAMTIAGAAGGAYAGHEVEKSRNKKAYWAVSIKMDSGKVRNLQYTNKPVAQEGERVKLLDGGKRLALIAE